MWLGMWLGQCLAAAICKAVLSQDFRSQWMDAVSVWPSSTACCRASLESSLPLRSRALYRCSDEVYALSVFKPEEAKFTSAITLAQQLVPPPPPEMKKQHSRLAPFFSRQWGSAADSSSSSSSSSDSDSVEEEEVQAKKRVAKTAQRALCEAKHQLKQTELEATKRKAEEEEAAAAALEAVKPKGSAGGNYSQELVDTYVHMLYGMSKDWCASGLRMGVLYSRNARLQQVGVLTGVG